MKYSEETLQSWTARLSQSEEERVERTKRMISEAINANDELSCVDYEIFVQGSYANNTNVRQYSDIDICIMLTSTFYTNYPDGITSSDFGYTDGSMSFQDFRSYVLDALLKKFGSENVVRKNKCIHIYSNSYHVNADVVPALLYKDYRIINSRNKNRFVEGIKYYAQDGTCVINYPKDHINNGKRKNNDTNYKYKKLVRIMKHLTNNMIGEGLINGDIISSFLVECLVWNVPNSYITKHDTWNATIQDTIAYLWNAINDHDVSEWREVSERLYLFRNRKWTDIDAQNYLRKMYVYLEYE